MSGLIEKSLGNVVFHAGLGDTALVDALIGSAELRSRALGEDPLYDALFEKYLNPSKQHARTH